jgi:hypothetical protein
MRFTSTGIYELFLEDEKKMVVFEVTPEEKVLLHKVERCLGKNLLLQTLDFKLGEIGISHSADGKSIYLGKFAGTGAQGLGIKLEEDGRFSAGCFARGKLNGVCKVTLPENDLFIGNMTDDFPDGEGLFYDAQRHSWLYGYFKNFECVTLLKDGITNALPYRRRIFANQFDKSRTCDRCAIEIPLFDFAKDFLKKIQPFLDTVESYLQDDTLKVSVHQSYATSTIEEKNSANIQIKGIPGENDDNLLIQENWLNPKREKDALRLVSSSMRGRNSKKSHSAENSERVDQFNKNANPEYGSIPKIIESFSQPSAENNAYFTISQLNLKSSSRLGTITEGEEDFCRSKSSVGERPLILALDKQSKTSTSPALQVTNQSHSTVDNPKKHFMERVPSPKPAIHEELSPSFGEDKSNLQSYWKQLGVPGVNKFNPVGNRLPKKETLTLNELGSRQKSLPATNAPTIVSNQIHNNVNINIPRKPKTNKLVHHHQGITEKESNILNDQWDHEERVKFQTALSKLERLDNLVIQLQEQVARSRSTQIFF